jgi:hypothetical protein
MASPLQILFAKAAIALIVGLALATLNVTRRRYGTFWPVESGQRTSVIIALAALVLAIPAYLVVHQYGQ